MHVLLPREMQLRAPHGARRALPPQTDARERSVARDSGARIWLDSRGRDQVCVQMDHRREAPSEKVQNLFDALQPVLLFRLSGASIAHVNIGSRHRGTKQAVLRSAAVFPKKTAPIPRRLS